MFLTLGALCEEAGACLWEPCENGATCMQNEEIADNYTCQCVSGT